MTNISACIKSVFLIIINKGLNQHENMLLIDFGPKRREDDVVIDWPIRYGIALGVAPGLAFLHYGCDPRILHGDVRFFLNILLDTEYEPYALDFGLATLASSNDTHVSGTMRGTFGYVAPKFTKSGRANEEVIVYSYGVILLTLKRRARGDGRVLA